MAAALSYHLIFYIMAAGLYIPPEKSLLSKVWIKHYQAVMSFMRIDFDLLRKGHHQNVLNNELVELRTLAKKENDSK